MDHQLHHGSQNDWLPDSAPTLTRDEAQEAWRPKPKPRGATRRRVHFAIAWTGMLLCGVGLWGLFSWVQPQPPIQLELFGAAYQDNLTVPHNVHGWRLLNDISRMPHDISNLDRQWNQVDGTVTLSQNFRWEPKLNGPDDSLFIACFSAHGAADEGGAYLLPHDCLPKDLDQRIRVEELIQSVASLPVRTKKLLVFDASHIESNLAYGILNNDFVRAFKQLEQQIASVPNLVVLLACNENQRSLLIPEQGRTVFGYFFAQGILSSAPDLGNDNRLNAWELFEYTKNEVSRWAQFNRQTNQVPQLLPSNEIGRRRAQAMDLRLDQRSFVPLDPVPQLADNFREGVRALWSDYHQRQAADVEPCVYTPARWREYQLALLRFEQLVRAGDLHGIKLLRHRIKAIAAKLDWESTSNSVGNNCLTLCQAGDVEASSIAKQADGLLEKLWQSDAGARTKVWDQAIQKPGNTKSQAKDLRRRMLLALFNRVCDDPVANLSTGTELSKLIVDPVTPPPADVQFLVMLDAHLPEEARQTAESSRLQLALDVRRMAKRAFWPNSPTVAGYAERLLPWTLPLIEQADQQRRLGEDLLFANADQRKRADEYLNRAKQLYQKAEHRAQTVLDAYFARDRVLGSSQLLNQWALHFQGTEDERRLVQQRMGDLFDKAHGLSKIVEGQSLPSTSSDRPTDYNAADSSDSSLEELGGNTRIVEQQYSTIMADLNKWWQDEVKVGQRSDWHAYCAAIDLAYGSPDDRVQLLTFREQQGTSKTNPSTGNQGAATSLTRPDKSAEIRNRQQSAIHAGRLALALIGQDLFDALRVKNGEDYQQVAYRLNVLQSDSTWQESVNIAGRQIAGRLRSLGSNAAESPTVGKSQASHPTLGYGLGSSSYKEEAQSSRSTDEPTFDTSSLELQAKQERRLGGLTGVASDKAASLMLRDRRRSIMLSQLAGRLIDDGWYDDSQDQPYYVRAARTLLNVSRAVWPENPQLKGIEQRLIQPDELVMQVPSRIDVTTEAEVEFRIGVRPQKDIPRLRGYPVLWIEPTTEVHISHPLTSQRVVLDTNDPKNVMAESCTFDNPLAVPIEERLRLALPGSKRTDPSDSIYVSTDMPKAGRGRSSATNASSDYRVKVVGFFRGRRMMREMDVAIHATPDITIRQDVPLDRAQLSVSTSKSMSEQFGKGKGAIGIVLDASGSMGSKKGKSFSRNAKYAEATRALKSVLESLPDGVQLSIWISGQAQGPFKSVRDARQTIRRVVPVTHRDRRDSGQIDDIMKAIEYPNIEPWNESPIVSTMLAAKQDLMGQDGFRTLLVITDGMDNVSQQTIEDGRSTDMSSSIKDMLKSAFDRSGITVNVVGFRVDSDQEKAAMEQFQVVEAFATPGKYVQADAAGELADAIATMMRQRLEYWIEPYVGGASDFESQRIAVTLDEQSIQWYPKGLEAGSYLLWTNARQTPSRIHLERGDRLLLRLTDDKPISVSRVDYLKTEYANQPSLASNRWRATVLSSSLSPANRLEMAIGIEHDVNAEGRLLRQLEPDEVWFELIDSEGELVKTPVTWIRDRSQPIPAWNVIASHWSGADGAQPKKPHLRVWQTSGGYTPAALRLEKGVDFERLEQLAGREVNLEGRSFTIEEAIVAPREIVETSGDINTVSTAILRIRHTPGRRYCVRLVGYDYQGREEVYFADIGEYTSMHWPIPQAAEDRSIRAIEFIAVDDIKQRAEQRGSFFDFDELPPPSADDIQSSPLKIQ
jgi:hypothetical protein